MRLEDMNNFVEVVNRKSFNKAAESLYITQPALGNSIKNFESELHHTLLHRSSSGISPTLFGKIVYKDCCDFLEYFMNIYNSWQEKSELYTTAAGHIRIGTFPLIAPFIVTNFSRELKHLCPKIEFSVDDLPLRHNLKRFFQNEVDIGLGILETTDNIEDHSLFKHAESMGLEIKLIWRDELKVLVSGKSKLVKKGYMDQKDMKELPLITYYANEKEHLYSSPSLNIIHAHTTDQIFQMLVANEGYFLACDKIANTHFAVQSGLVKTLEIRDTVYPTVYLYMVHPKEKELTIAQRIVAYLLYVFLADNSIEES